jgi:hypothetical protein
VTTETGKIHADDEPENDEHEDDYGATGQKSAGQRSSIASYPGGGAGCG